MEKIKDFSKMPKAKYGHDKVDGLRKGKCRIRIRFDDNYRMNSVNILAISTGPKGQMIIAEFLNGQLKGGIANLYCNGSEGAFKFLESNYQDFINSWYYDDGHYYISKKLQRKKVQRIWDKYLKNSETI